MTEQPMDAMRHRVSERPCCPLHGTTLGATDGQAVPVGIAGEPWILYDSASDGITTDRFEAPNKKVEGKAFAQTYVCSVGNHRVVVYRVIDRKPYPGRSYQVTKGLHPAWYDDKTPVTVPTGDGMRYPVVEALLRRVWGLQAVTDKQRVQRQARKVKKATERAAALKERRKPAAKRVRS
jgi:hypothetical protein